MKVLFLDVDGVINRFNPENISAVIESDLVEIVRSIIERTDAKVIISSSWKMSNSLMDLIEEELVPNLPKGSVIGCTPTVMPQINREIEIQRWLNKHQGEVESFCILDDYDFELSLFLDKGVCVITDALKGITESDADKCVSILNGEMI